MIQPASLRSLEGLRGFLALYVVLHHVRWLLWEQQAVWSQSPHPWWANILAVASASLRYGHEAVICFFVLSGFFIHFRWAKEASHGKDARLDVTEYARRRAHRLIPPYAVALVATVLLRWLPRPGLCPHAVLVGERDLGHSAPAQQHGHAFRKQRAALVARL